MQNNRNPSSRDFRRHRYWMRAKDELHRAYGRCAYTSRRLWGDDVSVDHFLPKTRYPQLAYEWDNYRLARPTLNSSKADSEDVVDPFRIRPGWFVLECPSCLIRPGNNLTDKRKRRIVSTINVLRLNNNKLANERCQWLVDLARDLISYDYLEREYPFLAFEVARQGIGAQLKTLFALR